MFDILTTIQNGVNAANEFQKQLNGSLLNIESQLNALTSATSAATAAVADTTTTIAVSSANVVLSSSEYESRNITFKSTLSASIAVTFPTSFARQYTIRNIATGSSAFTITLQTTASGGQVIACRPGNPFTCWNDGTNLYFVNLGTEIGGYWDYAGSSTPNWNDACTVPPYLNCIGGTFNSSVYPALFSILGSSILPDTRSRVRVALDQSAGVNSSATTGLSSVGTKSSAQATTLSSLHLPKLSDPGHVHVENEPVTGVGATWNTGGTGTSTTTSGPNTASATTGITYGSSSQIGVPIMQPSYIGGLTLIRAA